MPACCANSPGPGARSEGSASVIGNGLHAVGFGMRPVQLQSLVQVREPLAVHERLENAAHLETVIGPTQPPQEAQLHDAADAGIDPPEKPALMGGRGKKHPHRLHDICATEKEGAVPAAGVEFHELLAQQCKKKAYVIAELPWGDETRQPRLALLKGALPKI